MRNFGVEIELIGLTPSRATQVLTAAGITASNMGYTHDVISSWKVVTDSSITGARTCEVVSPILRGEEGLNEMVQVMKALDDAGADVNRSCGFHVHIDAAGLSPADLINIVKRYGRYEAEIDSFMPTSRRGSSNSYCSSMVGRNPSGNTHREVVRSVGARHSKVNLEAWVKYRTVEFRHHSGTLNGTKAKNWVLFLQAFVEDSIVRAAAIPAVPTVPMTNSLNRTQQAALRALRNGAWLTPAEIAMAAGISPKSVPTLLTVLRQDGWNVRRGRSYGSGVYRVTEERSGQVAPPPVTVVTDPGLWANVPRQVAEFYRVRKEVLA